MELRNIVLFVLLFTLGTLSASLIYEVGKISSETPSSVINHPIDAVENTLSAVISGKLLERDSPGDHIREDQIRVFSNKVELIIQDAIWSKFKNTNSMDPFLDEGANGIEIVPKDTSEIKIGDIISYESEDGDIIIHRVVGINEDENGIYFTAKGDNNPVEDSEKIRFEQIKGILVGIIY